MILNEYRWPSCWLGLCDEMVEDIDTLRRLIVL